MDKLKLKYIVNVGLLVSFLIAFITGVVKFPGLLQSLGVQVKELPWKQISRAHDLSGIIMSILVLVHLVQNWKWMVSMTKRYFGKKK